VIGAARRWRLLLTPPTYYLPLGVEKLQARPHGMETAFVTPGPLSLLQESWQASAPECRSQSACLSRPGRDHCRTGAHTRL